MSVRIGSKAQAMLPMTQLVIVSPILMVFPK